MDLPSTTGGDRFFAHAYIGTNGPYRLLVDTGASHTFLDDDTVDELRDHGSIAASERTAASVSVLGREARMSALRVPALRIGGLVADAPEVFETDLDALSRIDTEPVDGIAGMNLFRDVRLVLDFPRRVLRVEPSATNAPTGTTSLPFDGTMPCVDLDIAGQPRRMLVDSGFTGTFALADSDLPFSTRPVTANVLASATGFTESRAARLAANVDFAGVKFERPVIEVLERGQGLLGAGALRHYVVHIDSPAHRVFFGGRRDGTIVTVPGTRSLGFVFSARGHELVVHTVLPDSHAANLLQPGDRITRIGGRPARGWRSDLPELLNSGRETLAISLLRENKPVNLDLRIHRLLD
jgi:hypothetical protein